MKKIKPLLDFVLLLSLTVVSALAVAPKTFVMPNSLQMFILTALIGFIAAFLLLLWRESPEDEREADNQALASRAAYIVGALVLILALIKQSLHHHIDSAIPLALLAMIGTKIIIQRRKDAN